MRCRCAADKDGDGCELERELVDAHYVISQPFYPAYMTAERLAAAPLLKVNLLTSPFKWRRNAALASPRSHSSRRTAACLPCVLGMATFKAAITAGIGSDHVDLQAAMDRSVDVAEVTFCNSISVSEHVVMQILSLVRNYIPSYTAIKEGGWNIADCVERSYDVEGMKVGTVAAGRIGLAVLKRMHPFDCELHYCDRHRCALHTVSHVQLKPEPLKNPCTPQPAAYWCSIGCLTRRSPPLHRLPADVEAKYNLTHWDDWKEMVKEMDVVTLNCPLHPETEHMVNADTIKLFKKGAYLVNTARGKLCDRDVIVDALEGGQLAGYAGDVWFPQPPPADHPWRNMPWHGMTPHTRCSLLSQLHI